MGEFWHRITERSIGKSLAVFVLLLGLGAGFLVLRSEEARVREEYDARTLEYAKAMAGRIEQRLVAYDMVLRAGASLFAATQAPTRAQWRAFVEAFDLGRSYAGLQGIAFATVVQPEAIAALESEVRAEGLDSFRVWPSGPRVESSAILYIEPMNAANARALGFDMLSNPDRREAMHASRDSGETTLSRAVGLVQDTGREQLAGVLMYRAVYATGVIPQSVAARRAALQGWVYAPLRPADLMRSVRGMDTTTLVRLYDTASSDPRSLLYQDADTAAAERDWSGAMRVPVQALDRRWTLEVIRVPGGAAGNRLPGRSWALPAGVSLLGLLLFGVLWSMATTRDRAHRLAEEMTAALRRANEELDTRVRERTEQLSASNLQLREEIVERQRVERERSASLERERARAAQLRALADAGLAIPALADDQSRLEHLADRARQLVGCRHALLLREGALGARRIAVSSADPMSFANRRALLEASRYWMVGGEDRIARVRIESAAVDPRAWPEGCGDAMIVPIRIGNQPLLARLVLLHAIDAGFVPEDEVIVHQLVLLVTAAMATAEAVERERAARLDAESANASKDEFLAIVSHELRTPLHAILGWLQVLDRGSLTGNGNVQRAAQVIRRNAEAQSRLIDDLLDLARIEQGKLALELQRVRLDRVVRDAVESQRQPAAASGVSIELQADGPVEALGDAIRLQQAVSNLLVNAVKFSKSGARVSVRLQRDGQWLVLRVDDEGDGIEPELLPYVFDRFRQGESSGRSRKAGLGLGLALVKHIVEAHGGQVAVHSEGKGRGASFTVHLPVSAGPPVESPAWLGFFDTVASPDVPATTSRNATDDRDAFAAAPDAECPASGEDAGPGIG